MAKGDIRVLLALDIIFSVIYAYLVVWGLDFIDLLTFSLQNVGMLAAALAMITYLAVLR